MPNYLTPADWTFPIPIHYGHGRIAELGAFCAGAKLKRPLLVTDRNSRDLPFIGQTLAALSDAGVDGALFSDVSPNPTDREVTRGGEAFRDNGCDGVVAIGGGSGMDAGKAISLIGRNERNIWDFDYDKPASPDVTAEGLAPLICIPTTAGTGAETESTAMLTDPRRGVKGCVWHPAHKPRLAILDPDLTVGLPKNLTAWTGCDALVHAIEALSVRGFHPLCDALALEAIRLISRWLPVAVEDGGDREARGAMLAGACLAGIAFLKGLGLVHAMSHMVGAVCNTHHGLTNAVLLPVVLDYNREALAEKGALMAQAMALPEPRFDAFQAAASGLLDRMEIPRGLDALGVSSAQLPDIARKAHTDAARATNPVPSTVADIEKLLRQGLSDAR